MKIYNNIRELIDNTPMLKLNSFKTKPDVDIYAKLELWNPCGGIKDRMAVYMFDEAEKNGELKSGGTIIEATAGNTGIGFALAALLKGYKVVLVVPTKFSHEKLAVMKALGGEIVQTPREQGMLGATKKAEELLKQYPGSISMKQFENQSNPTAHYHMTGSEIYSDMDGKIDYFVAGAGTGGTFTGVMRYLKEQNPKIKGILADPEGSTMGGGEHHDYNIEGIGNDFIPATMDMSLVDRIIKVSDADALKTAREIVRKEGVIAGTSSGAILHCALKLAESVDKANIVVLFPDRGDRYISKGIYDL